MRARVGCANVPIRRVDALPLVLRDLIARLSTPIRPTKRGVEMPRPKLQDGTWGEFSETTLANGNILLTARYRRLDGSGTPDVCGSVRLVARGFRHPSPRPSKFADASESGCGQ